MMKVLQYIERIEMIHKLVEQECTGTPGEFARRLGISRTRLYEVMDDLKMEGAPIAYSRSCRTFYYEEPFHI
ncbi:MAG: DNA-binding protein, partial [Marinilabiliales bacterium]